MENPGLAAALAGFGLGGSLIIAIGAQNAFILRQGLLREHVFALCLLCAISDAILIVLGVGGFGTLIQSFPLLTKTVTVCGALFLFVYGLLAFRRAARPVGLSVTKQGSGNFVQAASVCLALTFLNPHVYLDTVILLGGISARYDGGDRVLFAAGAVLSSFLWFSSLGYGARGLSGIFERPLSWRVLDILIGSVMWLIAASLMAQFL